MSVFIATDLTFDRFIDLLKMDYPSANIPLNATEADWRNAARQIISDPAFNAQVPPTPDGYAEPIEWIRAFSNAIF